MAKEMKRRDLERALSGQGFLIMSDRGPHMKWSCPCGRHSANVPRHAVISPGVVADTIRRLECLPKGWLQ